MIFYISLARMVKISCLLFLILIIPVISYAQCPSANATAWPPGSVIQVYIDPTTMSPDEIAQIQSAIDKWNTANQTNGSGLQFQQVFSEGGAPQLIIQTGANPITNSDGTTSYAAGTTYRTNSDANQE